MQLQAPVVMGKQATVDIEPILARTAASKTPLS